MKRINYLIVAMLMAFTMVGCQVDLSDYLTKEEADAKYATIAYVDGKVADLETKINNIDAKFADYYTKGEVVEKLKGYATKESLETIGDISKAVKDYLETVNWNDYIEDGYTNDEIDVKLKAITDITDKLEETYATLEKVTELSKRVDNLKIPTTDEIAQIETKLQNWCQENLNGATVDLTNYVMKTDVANYVDLSGYAKTSDIPTDYVSTTDFNNKVEEIEGRIAIVENLLKVNDKLETKLSDLIADINNKADATTILTIDTIKNWYDNYTDKFNSLDLSAYLTNALSEYAKTEDIPTDYYTKNEVDEMVETVASSLAELTSRVETLETILEIEKKENETISKLKVDYLALKSTVETLATSEALTELSGTIETLKTTVANNKIYLERKIADNDTNIGAIKTRVDNLENAQATFDTFVTTTTSAIANLNTIVSNKADTSDIETLIANYITNSTTLVTKSYLEAQNYITSGSLSGYATTEKVTELETTVNEAKTYIESINSKYASLVSNMVEINANIIDEYNVGSTTYYYYYPYVKFINTNGTVEYMTLLDTRDSDTKFGLKSPNRNLTLKELMTNIHWSTNIQFMSETKFNETVNSLKE